MIDEKEINCINIQIIASVLSIATIITSILLLYNEKLDLRKEKVIFSKDTDYRLTLLNRIIILLIFITFFTVNYYLYKYAKEKGKNLEPYTLQLFASSLTVVASIIIIYIVASQRNTEQIFNVENPTI